MSSAVLVRLRPTGPWRIGPDSSDRDRVDRIYHSDSLYSAITGAMASLGEVEAWLDATARAAEPAVRLSSCFPFHGDLLLAPPPLHVWPPPASSKVRWKGAKFVPLKVIEALLSAQPLNEDAWSVDTASECLLPSSLLAPSSGAQSAGLFRTSVRSNAAVDRAGEGVHAHSTACVEFTAGSGLWFVAEFLDHFAAELWRGRLTAALRLLADSGFGGGRSRGWGRAESPEVIAGSLPELLIQSSAPSAEAGSGFWLLSLFHPAEADPIDWNRGNYALTTRTGRMESGTAWGEPKKPTRMVTEGSVLVAASSPRGSMVEVGPDAGSESYSHPVYRAGLALSLAVPLRPVA